LNKLLYKLGIKARCPNCESAWTGGHPDPWTLTHCVVCGNKRGEITGWVWGRLIDPFCWLGQRNVARNMKKFYEDSI
jgi:hypothetical protein